MGKIGFINVCHQDYLCEDIYSITDKAVENLEMRGVNVVYKRTPVTTMEEATRVAKEIVFSDVDGVIVFLGSWLECPVCMSVIKEIRHLPFSLWGIMMYEKAGVLTSTGSYVSFSMFKGVLDRLGYSYKAILGNVDNEKALNEAVIFAKAAKCYGLLNTSKIALYGYTSMGIYTGTFDHVLMRDRIGPEICQKDSYTLINLAESKSLREKEKAIDVFKSYAKIKDDVKEEMLSKAAGIYLALDEINKSENFAAINVKCQCEFSKEYGMVACVPLSAIAETGVVSSCEGDIMNTVSMLILKYLSDSQVGYGDCMTHFDNVIKFSSCGFIPFSLGVENEQVIGNFLPHPGFTGIQNSFVYKQGRVTIMRLIEDVGEYHILYCTGLGLHTNLRQGYMPALDVLLDGDVNDFIKNYNGQHYAICYGDLSEEIETLSKMLKIRTIKV